MFLICPGSDDRAVSRDWNEASRVEGGSRGGPKTRYSAEGIGDFRGNPSSTLIQNDKGNINNFRTTGHQDSKGAFIKKLAVAN
jgi:hypothetical protein